MRLTGLPLSQLLAIGAAAALATVALYLLKLRRRAVAVPFAKLWERVVREREATTLFSRLKRLLSLLLQLALLALLIFALGDPRLGEAVVGGRNVVVLIDASASMQATDEPPSRLESARGRVREMVRGLSGADRLLVAQMDAAVTPLSTLSGDQTELEGALTRLAASDARADFPRALRFASDTLRGLPKAEIVVVSDGSLGEAHDALGEVHLGEAKLSFVKVGRRGKNAAVTQFSVRRYPLDKARYEVMLEVTNADAAPAELELSLLGDGQLVDVTRLRLGAGERLPRFYPNLSGASRTLEARIRYADGSTDDLPADDRAYALLPERRRVKVQCVTRGNTYLEAALLLDEYLEVTTVDPARYPSPGRFDVTIFDGAAPRATEASGAALYLAPTGDGAPLKLGAEIVDVGFDEYERKHPLWRWIVLDPIGIGRARALEPAEGDRVLASSVDERGGKKRPLVVAGRREGRRFIATGFDPRDSDMVLRIAWPLFLLNAINDFVDEDARYLSSYRTGEVWHLPAPSGAEHVTLIDPAGATHELAVEDGRALFLGQRAGFYTLRSGAAAPGAANPPGGAPDAMAALGAGETMFAANLSDATESAIGPAENVRVGGVDAGTLEGFRAGVRREIWVYLLAAAVALTALEWFTYHRRITV
ncbi:MAG: VWA domain-containing protein [Polyangiaceae bacterium]|nr:VWA domain-containing protein [Polyangiaceae bacterium]